MEKNISSGGINFKLIFPGKCVELDNIINVLIPGLIEITGNNNFSHEVYYIKSNYRLVKTNLNKGITYFYDEFSKPKGYFYFYLLQLFEFYYNKNDMFSFHSSAVDMNGNGALLLGEFGSGKSSTALYTSDFDNVSILSNNRTLLNYRGKIIAGTEHMSFKQNFENINKGLFQKYKDNGQIEYFKDRIIVKNSIKFRESNLKKIFWLKINSGVKEIKKFKKDEAIELYLYNNISRLISGESVLFEGTYPSDSFDSSDFKMKRISFLNKIISDDIFIYISGPIDYISYEICKYLLYN